MTKEGYVKKDNFNSASTEMLKILVKTTQPGSEARDKATAELARRERMHIDC